MATGKTPWQAPSNVKRSEDMTGIWPSSEGPSVFDWVSVDGGILRAALHVCAVKGVGLNFGAAMGGRGLVVTLYTGTKPPPKRFALSAVELHDLLLALIDGWGSPSEDLAVVFGYGRSSHLEAD